jgi:RNA polymerase sigma-70 factor (ECF subfamily)
MSLYLKSWLPDLFARPEKGENRYPTTQAWLEGLRTMDTHAIVLLMEKTAPTVRQVVRRLRLPESVAADILHDAVVILVKKIRDQAYDPSQSAPPTYLIGVAKKLAANQARKHHLRSETTPVENHEILDPHSLDYTENRDRRELLEHLLGQLGEPCAQLIRLKYIDGYSDEEILSREMTHYKTPMALRSRRSQCFQKLMELAASTKNKAETITEHNP